MFKSDREVQRGRALASIFSKTDRIIARDAKLAVHTTIPDEYRANGYDQYPGFTAYPNIYMNLDVFGSLTKPETMIQLLGLNYHELGHVLFTPRKFQEVVVPRHLQRAFNLLEDQRIESFFTAQYEPAGKFFTEMVIRFIVGDPNAWASAFLWTHGRSFLPLEIREEFEARFALPHKVEEGKDIIERYKTFTADNFVANQRAVKNTIQAFQDLLDELESNGNQQPQDTCHSSDQQAGKVDEDKEEESAKEDRKKRNREKRTGEDQSNFWDDEDEEEDDEETETNEDSEGDGDDHDEDERDEDGSADGNDDEEDDDDSDDDGEGEAGDDQDGDPSEDSEEHADGDAEGDSDSDDIDSDEGVDKEADSGESASDSDEHGDGEDGEDGENSDGVGETPGEPQFTNKELKEYLADIVEAVAADESVEEELGRVFTAINDSSNMDFIDFGQQPYDLVDAELADLNIVNAITTNLRRMYAEVEPGWRYGSDVGKLNVGRAMLDPENYDEHFDEWEEGREHETGLEVVLDVDLSGSMGGTPGSSMWHASKALWMLKRSLEEVEAKVTVLGFHETTMGLYDRDDKMPRSQWPLWKDLGGNTLPAGSFNVARQILTTSTAPNKLFVAITDGGWGDYDTVWQNGSHQYVQHDLAELLAAIPGTRMYVGVDGGGAANQQYSHLFATRRNIGTCDELVSLVSKTVDVMMKERLFG